jgi:hypothetical protein
MPIVQYILRSKAPYGKAYHGATFPAERETRSAMRRSLPCYDDVMHLTLPYLPWYVRSTDVVLLSRIVLGDERRGCGHGGCRAGKHVTASSCDEAFYLTRLLRSDNVR